jgi:hypothetical protein
MIRIKRITFSILILILIASRSFAAEIVTISPWITVLTHFLGGIKVNVTPLSAWDNGKVSRAKIRNTINSETYIIALDKSEITKIGLDPRDYKNARYLYEKAPFDESECDKYFGDPSVLPFIAQRLLPVLSSFDPENFSYYQRRLAEFQTRLSSTILAGRNLLKGQKVLDMTVSYGYFLIAAGCDVSKLDQEDVDEWVKQKQMEVLIEMVVKNQKENKLVIIDAAAPKTIRTALSSLPNIITLSRPPLDQDFLAFLHDQYLIIWNEIKDKVK